jgi:hypothetical protein
LKFQRVAVVPVLMSVLHVLWRLNVAHRSSAALGADAPLFLVDLEGVELGHRELCHRAIISTLHVVYVSRRLE